MKALMLICAFFTAEAAKLQGYVIQRPGPTDTSSPTTSTGSAPVPHGQVNQNPQQQFDIRSKPSFTSPGQHPSPTIPNYINPAVFGQSTQNTQVHGSAGNGVNNINPTGSGQPIHNTQVYGSAGNGVNGANQVENNSLGSGSNETAESCPEGQVRHYDGSCITPEITRHVFVYESPKTEPTATSSPVDVPLPKVEHNIVFIQTQDQGDGTEPIIVPPPQKKHIIYVLSKNSGEGQRVIEIPAPELKKPEVYFVNYADGETPTLPDGIDFETALNSAIHAQGQVIGGDSGPTNTNHGGNLSSDLAATSELVNGISGNENPGLTSSEYYSNNGNPNSGNGGNVNNRVVNGISGNGNPGLTSEYYLNNGNPNSGNGGNVNNGVVNGISGNGNPGLTSEYYLNNGNPNSVNGGNVNNGAVNEISGNGNPGLTSEYYLNNGNPNSGNGGNVNNGAVNGISGNGNPGSTSGYYLNKGNPNTGNGGNVNNGAVNGISGNGNPGSTSGYYLNNGNPNSGNGGNVNNGANTEGGQRFSITSNSQYSSTTNSEHTQSSATDYKISGFSRVPQEGSNSATFPGTNSNVIAQSSGNGNQIPGGFGHTSPQQLYAFP